MQVVVIVLVAVEESNDLCFGAKEHVAVEPAECKWVPAGCARPDSLRPVWDALSEGAKRLWDLHRDRLTLVIAQPLKVGLCTVSQRPHFQSVPHSARQVGQNLADACGRELWKPGMNGPGSSPLALDGPLRTSHKLTPTEVAPESTTRSRPARHSGDQVRVVSAPLRHSTRTHSPAK